MTFRFLGLLVILGVLWFIFGNFIKDNFVALNNLNFVKPLN